MKVFSDKLCTCNSKSDLLGSSVVAEFIFSLNNCFSVFGLGIISGKINCGENPMHRGINDDKRIQGVLL